MASLRCLSLVVAIAVCSFAATGVVADSVSHGVLVQLPTRCRGELTNVWTAGYGGKTNAMVRNATVQMLASAVRSTSDTVMCGAPCQKDCQKTIQTALDAQQGDPCPNNDKLRACFRVAQDLWSEFVTDCILFNTQPTSKYQKNTELLQKQAAEAGGESAAAVSNEYGCFPLIDTSDEFDDWILYG